MDPLGALDSVEKKMVSVRDELFEFSMRGEWDRVVEIYSGYPGAYRIKITKPGDTALHLAARDRQVRIVEKLLNAMKSHPEEAKEALRIRNQRGNTALHLAASVGNERICRSIAAFDPLLVGVRNSQNETPLFSATKHGRKLAFLCLDSLIRAEDVSDGSYYRRGVDGDTVLHVAIAGDYFDLAFQIIQLHEELVNFANMRGETPLHILSAKPNGFKSCTHLFGYQRLIYHCIIVDKLTVDTYEPSEGYADPVSYQNPNNYQTCTGFFLLPYKAFESAKRTWSRSWRESSRDEENQQGSRRRALFIRPNCNTCFDILKFTTNLMLVVLGLGSMEIRKLQEKKEAHTWCSQILKELLRRSGNTHEHTGKSPQGDPYKFSEDANPFDSESDQTEPKGVEKQASESIYTSESPILISAKNGITEIVEKILDKYPVAIHDVNNEKKNIVLLTVENRQPQVYQMLLQRQVIMKDSVFIKTDEHENSALHLAAKLGIYKPWRISGAALQMQWEIKWYEFVKNSMPPNFFARYNKNGETADDIFSATHKDMVKSGGEWLTHTSNSCSVVAALIATVAFATSSTVPGGVNESNGTPILEKQPAFHAFAIASLIALCFSVTALVMFLAILTSRYQEKDFGYLLPRMLILGLTSLFISIAAILVSFCAGHFFVLKDELKFAAFPVYVITCLPVTFFAIAQCPLYFDLILATIQKVPQRGFMVVS